MTVETIQRLQKEINILQDKADKITIDADEFTPEAEDLLNKKSKLVKEMIQMKIFLKGKHTKEEIKEKWNKRLSDYKKPKDREDRSVFSTRSRTRSVLGEEIKTFDFNIFDSKKKVSTEIKKDYKLINLNKYLNNIYNVDFQWNYKKTKNNNINITHNGCLCLKDNKYECEDTCLIVSNNKILSSCHLHKQKKLNKKNFKKLFNILGITEKINRRKIDITGCDYDYKIVEYAWNNANTTHEDISQIFYYLFNTNLVCASETPRPIWYYYEKGLWNDTKGTSKLKKLINNEVVRFYTYMIDVLTKTTEGDTETYPEYNTLFEKEIEHCDFNEMVAVITIYEKVIDCLKTASFCNALVNHCIHYFKINGFIEKLDHNIHLLCFGENVYDLKTCEWRKTVNTDLCSKKCGVSKEDINNKENKKVNKILNDIFSINEDKEYIIDILSDLLYGENNKNIFQIWQGLGANGKGLLAIFLKYIFGDYYAESNIALLTQKSGSANSASPELARLQGIRVAMFSEPEQGAKLNNGLIKKITGGEKISARKLYCDSVEYMPHFTPIIQCNTGFSMEDITDESIPRRLRFIEFKNQFVNKEDITSEYHKLKDISLKEKHNLDKIKGSFMFILLERWEKLTKEAKEKWQKLTKEEKKGKEEEPHIHLFKTPDSVRKTQQEFLNDNNLVKLFVKENVEIVKKENRDNKNLKYIKLKQLIEAYREWFHQREEKKCKIKRAKFIKRINKYLPKLYKDRYRKGTYNLKSIYIHCVLTEEDEEDELYEFQ